MLEKRKNFKLKSLRNMPAYLLIETWYKAHPYRNIGGNDSDGKIQEVS